VVYISAVQCVVYCVLFSVNNAAGAWSRQISTEVKNARRFTSTSLTLYNGIIFRVRNNFIFCFSPHKDSYNWREISAPLLCGSVRKPKGPTQQVKAMNVTSKKYMHRVTVLALSPGFEL
jgi:hypothetical protein